MIEAHHECGGTCGGEYECPGCERLVGYCSGASDELGELCDDCACEVWSKRELYNPEYVDPLERVSA